MRSKGFAAYKELLDARGFHPSRRLGQNFLLDPSLHRVLVDAVAPRPEDLVVEVGAGLGFLTRELAGRCRVVAVEIDDRLFRLLQDEVATFPGGGADVRLLHADVLSRSRINPAVLEVLAEERAAGPRGIGRLLVVANLPYAIAGPLLAEFSSLDQPPIEMAVLVQLELAERLTAVPGTRAYGALAVQLQLGYEARFLRKVGAQVFRPRPNVDSGMVHFGPRPDGCRDRPAAERRAMGVFWRQVFAARRKKLKNAAVLRSAVGGELVAHLPADLLDRRPDAATPAELLALWDARKALIQDPSDL